MASESNLSITAVGLFLKGHGFTKFGVHLPMVRILNLGFGVIAGEEEERGFNQKRNNSPSNFSILSTHLSGDQVQGIVLGSRSLFLSRPSPPSTPLRPHVSSKILDSK